MQSFKFNFKNNNLLEIVSANLLYIFIFLLPLQTRLILKPGSINGGLSEYLTLSVYGSDILLLVVICLFFASFLTRQNQPQRLKNHQEDPNHKHTKKTKFKIDVLWFLIAVLELFIFISIFIAPDKLVALQAYFRFLLGVGIFWIIVKANYSFIKLVYFFVLGVSLQALVAIWQFFSQADFSAKWLGDALQNPSIPGVSVIELANGERFLRAYGSLDHPNILGGYLVMAIILLLSLQRAKAMRQPSKEKNQDFHSMPISVERQRGEEESEKNKTLSVQCIIFNQHTIIQWLILAVLTTALFFTFSRSAWLALGAGLLVIFLLFARERKLLTEFCQAQLKISRLGGAVIVIIIFVFFGFVYSDLVKTRLTGIERLEQKSAVERVSGIKDSFQIIKKHPIFGVGIGNYTNGLKEIYPDKPSWFYQPVHNIFLLVAAEIGIFGFIAFLILLFWILKIVWKLEIGNWKYNKTYNIYNIILFGALLVMMNFDHFWWSLHFGILLFWLILALLITEKNTII